MKTAVLFCIPPSGSRNLRRLKYSAWGKDWKYYCRGGHDSKTALMLTISLEYWTSTKVLVGENAGTQEATSLKSCFRVRLIKCACISHLRLPGFFLQHMQTNQTDHRSCPLDLISRGPSQVATMLIAILSILVHSCVHSHTR